MRNFEFFKANRLSAGLHFSGSFPNRLLDANFVTILFFILTAADKMGFLPVEKFG